MRLGVLDTQHPRWAAALAPKLERLGYGRYWLGEHHGSAGQSGSPEVLTGILAAITRRIRIGPAGVLLRYYSPYKVVQSHRLLDDLFPGRIDLGIARGLGGGAAVTEMLLDGRPADTESYEAKVGELARMLQGRLPDEHPARGAVHFGSTDPPGELWVLGTSARAARLAGSLGASFAWSEYIARMTEPDADGAAVIRAYRDAFEPAPGRATPQWNVAVAGAAVPEGTQIETLSLAGPPPLLGSVDAWRRRLRETAERYESEEVIFFDLCTEYCDRERSYGLLAEAAELSGDAG